MIIFAIELSTVRASVAICDDARVLAETSWTEPQARHQRIFDETPKLLAEAGLGWPQIDLFAVGRGPGAFSGIRIGMMAAQMFALPLRKPVVAVSSGEALAEGIETAKRRDGASATVICGDARRGMFWFGIFDRGFSGWKLCTVEEWRAKCEAGFQPITPGKTSTGTDARFTIATPHWNQTAPLRAATCTSHRWIEGDQFPTAPAIAQIARTKSVSEPLEPIYLHPPV